MYVPQDAANYSLKPIKHEICAGNGRNHNNQLNHLHWKLEN